MSSFLNTFPARKMTPDVYVQRELENNLNTLPRSGVKSFLSLELMLVPGCNRRNLTTSKWPSAALTCLQRKKRFSKWFEPRGSCSTSVDVWVRAVLKRTVFADDVWQPERKLKVFVSRCCHNVCANSHPLLSSLLRSRRIWLRVRVRVDSNPINCTNFQENRPWLRYV